MPTQSIRRTADSSRDSRDGVQRHGHGDQRHRDVQEEDPLPAGLLDEQAADAPGPCRAPGRRCRPRGRARAPARGRWKASVMIESEPGIRNAAPAPWTPRKKISCSIDCDSPAPIEPSVNTTRPARNMRLRPNTSPSRPPVTSRTPKHQRVGVDRPREAGDGRAEVGLDRGQGDVHDGVVEHHHEQGEAHRPQRPPLAVVLGQNRHQRSSFVLSGGQHPEERLPHLLELPRGEHREGLAEMLEERWHALDERARLRRSGRPTRSGGRASRARGARARRARAGRSRRSPSRRACGTRGPARGRTGARRRAGASEAAMAWGIVTPCASSSGRIDRLDRTARSPRRLPISAASSALRGGSCRP